MKNRILPRLSRLLTLALAAAGFHAALPAQDNALPSPGPINSDISIIKAKRVAFGTSQAYDIADGVTFEIKDTLLAAGNGTVFDLNLSSSADMFFIRPAPNAADQSGRFIFSNNRSNAYSGVGHISRGTLVLNNGIIMNNYAASHGGVFTLGSNGLLRFANILFQGNSVGPGAGGGVISFRSNIAGRPPGSDRHRFRLHQQPHRA